MMNDDMNWMKMKWAHKAVTTDLLLSISFSLFGMLLIFGLGFVFPTINPYIVIKWIIIVAGVVFVISFLKYVFYLVTKMRALRAMKDGVTVSVKTSGTSKTKRSTRK